jgi:ectoine hydroxylase-related dioxygenase (phytanoyl-CoA dioxygenase family)
MGPLTHQPTISLTSDQIAFFKSNGFLSLPRITSDEEVAMIRESYDRLFANQAGRAEGRQFDLAGTDEEGKEAALPQILTPEKDAPELWDTQARANALHICRQLLGEDVQAQGSHAIFKPAHHGATTPWHQDESYWGAAADYRSMSVWMPLQDVDEANGCMQFIPGTHKMEVVPHRPINNDPRIHGLELAPEAGIDTSHPVICPLPAGGATFHPSRTMHYTAANHSDRPRRALIMMFGAPARKRADIGLPPRRFPWTENRQTAREQRAAQAGKPIQKSY